MTVNRQPWRAVWSAIIIVALPIVAIGSALAMEQGAGQTPTTPVSSSNPLSGKQEAIDAGRKLYYTWCTQCHGPKADGVSRFGSYASDLRGFWRGYNQFIIIVKNGRTDRQMPPWKEVLDNTQISQIGAFLETLSVEGAQWKD